MDTMIDTTPEMRQANRIVLCHFDSYSSALVFARWADGSLLMPGPLPASAAPGTPRQPHPEQEALAVAKAFVADYGLHAADTVRVEDFDEWIDSPAGAVRVHLLRCRTFEAPADLIAGRDASFRPISELRRSLMIELGLVRKVFDLIMGGNGR